jgi:long-chain acyl-CoA synthetase
MFQGYFGGIEAADMREGWLHTGDAGYFDKAGRLVVIDRIKDIASTATGTKFSPQYIENKLKFSPYVAEAVVLGDGKPHLAAIICIRFPIVSKWAERNRISFTTYTDLSARAQVQALISAEVAKVNATLPEAQRIRDFVLLYKELDADDDELTRTRKVGAASSIRNTATSSRRSMPGRRRFRWIRRSLSRMAAKRASVPR